MFQKWIENNNTSTVVCNVDAKSMWLMINMDYLCANTSFLIWIERSELCWFWLFVLHNEVCFSGFSLDWAVIRQLPVVRLFIYRFTTVNCLSDAAYSRAWRCEPAPVFLPKHDKIFTCAGECLWASHWLGEILASSFLQNESGMWVDFFASCYRSSAAKSRIKTLHLFSFNYSLIDWFVGLGLGVIVLLL